MRRALRRFAFGLLFSTVVVLFATPLAQAAKFSNQFVEFELPYSWKCILEGADWVCQSEDQNKKKDAIIVLAAKLKGDQDSLDKYRAYLNKPRLFNAPGGKAISSQPKYTADKPINDQIWVDSLHLESEIPGFFTRYLATVKEDIGVLITYSVNKTKYQDYQKQFDDMVSSIKVFRKAGGLNQKDVNLFNAANQGISNSGIFSPVTGDTGQTPVAAAPKPAAAEGSNAGALALIGAAAVAFIIWRKRRSGGG